MANGPYTQEGIMSQVLVAFGQGTGAIRVSHDAAVALRTVYFGAITDDIINNKWPTQGVQALERLRAIGRLAAAQATQRGDTTISADDVRDSAKAVHTISMTDFCPPVP